MRVAGGLSSALVVVVTSALVTSALGAQAPAPSAPTPGQPAQGQAQPQAPSRTPQRPLRPGEGPPKGTGIIRGQIMAAETGAPIRRAQVRVMSMDGRGGGVTSTDDEGRYEVKDLPAGRFNISASKGSFVTVQYGQRKPNQPGTPIELSEGQGVDRVNIALPRGSVITGRIVDDTGEPVSGAQVSAQRFAFMSGARRLMGVGAEGGFDRTDDQGLFRLYGLPPGDYYVSAVSRSGVMFGGQGLNNTEADGFAPTFYPGTPNIAEAQRVVVRVGQEATANFGMVVARMAKLKGHVMSATGTPLRRGMVMLAPADGAIMFSSVSSGPILPDGAFALANVAPGRYNLQVRPIGMGTADDEFASMPILVGSDDMDNIVVTASTGAKATGIISTDDGSAPDFRADAVQVFANPTEPSTMSVGNAQSKVHDDFSFELTGLFDRSTLRGTAGANSGWYMKAVYADGNDVTDTGVQFEPGRTYGGFDVVFTKKATDLSGLVTDDRGRAVVDATVVVFPSNRDHWTFLSRFIRTARPDTQGRYQFKAIPPGNDYLIVAVRDLENGQANDPEFLARALDEAERLTLAEGETKAMDVKLSPLVP